MYMSVGSIVEGLGVGRVHSVGITWSTSVIVICWLSLLLSSVGCHCYCHLLVVTVGVICRSLV